MVMIALYLPLLIPFKELIFALLSTTLVLVILLVVPLYYLFTTVVLRIYSNSLFGGPPTEAGL
jgi:hypothetical protein